MKSSSGFCGRGRRYFHPSFAPGIEVAVPGIASGAMDGGSAAADEGAVSRYAVPAPSGFFPFITGCPVRKDFHIARRGFRMNSPDLRFLHLRRYPRIRSKAPLPILLKGLPGPA